MHIIHIYIIHIHVGGVIVDAGTFHWDKKKTDGSAKVSHCVILQRSIY